MQAHRERCVLLNRVGGLMSLQFITRMSWPWYWLLGRDAFLFFPCKLQEIKGIYINCIWEWSMLELNQSTRVCYLVTSQGLLALGHTLQNELSSLWGYFCRICQYSVCLLTDLSGKSNSWLAVGLFLSSFPSSLPPCPLPLFSQYGLQVWVAASRRPSAFYQRHCDWGWDYGGS